MRQERDFSPELARLIQLGRVGLAKEIADTVARQRRVREENIDRAVEGTRRWFTFVDPATKL